ncbi:MAG: ABC transporter permease [Candidatus Hodarchaeota archaeon]
MNGTPKKSIQDQSISKTLLSLKNELIESIRNRNLIAKFSIKKQSLRDSVHLRGYKIRNLSLRKVMRNSFQKNMEESQLAFGLAKRNVSRSKYRSFLLIFGILLTIALETGIVVSVDTLYDDFIFDNRNQNYTDIRVIPQQWHNLSRLTTLSRDIKSVSGVSRASPVYSILVTPEIIGQDYRTNILIYGIEAKTHPDFPRLNITDGGRRVAGNTVVISQNLQQAIGFHVGDTFEAEEPELGIGPKELRIGGIMSDSSFFGNNIGYQFILVDIETLYEIVPDEHRINILSAKIDVSVNNLAKIKKTSENIKDKVGVDYFVLIEKRISEIQATGIRAYQTAMNLVILASFVVEFLFITNILAIAIHDRSKEFGILRAVGCGSTQLIAAITIEILIYSFIGGILGIISGIGFGSLLVWLIQFFFTTYEFQALSLNLTSLLATFASGIIVALISGLYPIFIALSTPVVQNIHSRMRTRKSSTEFFSYWKYTISMGILLAIVGFSLQFFIGPSRFLDFEILSIHFVVILFIFIGTLLVEVGILFFLPKIAYKILFWFGIITRTISTRNIAREFQKSLFTIITSALALTFIIVVGLVSAAIISAVPVYFQNQWGSIELVAEAHDSNLPHIDFTDELDSLNSISSSSFIQEARTEIQGVDSYVFGVDPLKYSSFEEEVIDSMQDLPSSYYLRQTDGNHTTHGTYALVSDFLFSKLLKPLGSNITVKTIENNTVNITIASVIKSNVFLGNGEYLYIGTKRFQEFFNSTQAKWFICDVWGDVGSAQVIVETHYPDIFIDVIGIDFYKTAIERSLRIQSILFQVLFIESFCLAAIAQFICILVSTLRMEREMGIMRSLGLHKRGVLSVFMAESTALGFSALFVGLIDGLIGSVLLAWYISLSIPVQIVFPLDRIILWVFISLLVTLASTLLPSYRSSQKNIIATISGRPMYKQYISKPVFHVSQAFYSGGGEGIPFSQYSSDYKMLQEREISSKVQIGEIAQYSKITTWQFIKDHKLQIQTVFLVIMAIVTFNYIIDGYIFIRGLLPSDFIWRIVMRQFQIGNFGDFFDLINPLLLYTGLAAIGPISYYLINGTTPSNLIKEMFISLISGFIVILVCFLMIFIQLLIFLFITLPIIPLLSNSYPDYSNISVVLVLAAIFFLVGIGIELILFQRLWNYLIIRGLSPGRSFRQRLNWTIRTGSKGQIIFIGLLLFHIFFQSVLFILTQPSYPFDPKSVAVDPLIFLVLTSFEVGSYLFLIIYQIVQLMNQRHLFTTKTASTTKPHILHSKPVYHELTSESSYISKKMNE